jgi:hypothetical protein
MHVVPANHHKGDTEPEPKYAFCLFTKIRPRTFATLHPGKVLEDQHDWEKHWRISVPSETIAETALLLRHFLELAQL